MIRPILLILCLAATSSYGQQLVTETITSQILRDNKTNLNPKREIKIYLPPGYASSNKHYPVVYYCHNFFWSPKQMIDDGRAFRLIDRAFEKQISREFIFVVADFTGPGMGCLYENSSTSGRWLDYITQELVPTIDSKFRTIANRDSRAAVGDFFGGRGALKLGMSHANLFSVVYAMHPVATGNGSLPWATLNINWKKLAAAKTFEDLAGPDRTAIFMGIHQAFLPNPNRPPFYCDYSIELINGKETLVAQNILKTKREFLLDETLPECVDNLRSLRGLALDWARFDETRAHVESNRDFSMKLEDLGIPHIAEEYNGTPFNKLMTDDGRFITRVVPFLDQHLVFEK